MEEHYGELYCLPNYYNGEWNDNLIHEMSELKIIFEEITDKLPNGINIKINNEQSNTDLLGNVISSFLIRSYLIKYLAKYGTDGASISYLSPVNIILDSIDGKYPNLVSEKTIQNIISILNHPHFENSYSIYDLQCKLLSVKNLNSRFI